MPVRSALVTTGLVIAYYLLPPDGGRTGTTTVLFSLGLVGVAPVFAWEALVVTRSPYPRLKAVEALALTLPLSSPLFATAYHLLGRTAPDSFSESLTRTDSLYLALPAFTTVGYGDITAQSQTARVLTMVQMAVGLLFVGVAAHVLTDAVRAGLRQQQRKRPPG
ncbi:potassium channel family protein [Streptomyces thermogriseus]|uniref:Potassium channel domain-containing protein n=1 Tax=Streptomyces thermogriseus TaxID=75292 RepID=A0ABN1SVP7_9ACTN